MYLPGKCNKTFKMGEAGSFTFEDGKVRAAPAAKSAMRSIASPPLPPRAAPRPLLLAPPVTHAACRPWMSTPRSPPSASRWTRRRSRSTTT
jgi:hypothetical protein